MGVLGVDHIAFRTRDPAGLRDFYRDLLDAEPLAGEHLALRAGTTVLAFFEADEAAGGDEIAFAADGSGFQAALVSAERMAALCADRLSTLPLPVDSTCATQTDDGSSGRAGRTWRRFGRGDASRR